MHTQKSSGGPLIKRGSRGPEVRDLQQKLAKLGLNVEADGAFGENTERAVIQFQTMFGYDVDGIVGPATSFLIDQQLGYGWNAQAPDAAERALRAQGKSQEAQKPAAGSTASAKPAPQKPAASGSNLGTRMPKEQSGPSAKNPVPKGQVGKEKRPH